MDNKKNAKITRRNFLKTSAVIGAGTVAGQTLGCQEGQPGSPKHTIEVKDAPKNSASPLKPKRPNILYIFPDQHRGDVLGPAGHPIIKTPNLNRIARDGVTFGRCYSNGPLCRPGRASMMTGLYPHEHGVWHNYVVGDSNGPSHVRQMRDDSGYHTAVIGKTHLHKGEAHLDSYTQVLRDWGFSFSHELTGPGQSADIENKYTDWLTRTTKPGDTDKYQRFRNFIHHYIDDYFLTPWDAESPDEKPWELQEADHLDRYTGQIAAKWIREYSDEQPFYLQVNFPGPHDPLDATTNYKAMYDPADPKMPPGILDHPQEPVSELIRGSQKFQNVTHITPEQQRRFQQSYYAKVTLVDRAVGDLLDALEARGFLENTWVIYGSDHGEMLGDHYLTQKGVFYEPAVHIPCLIRPPKGTRPWSSNALVDQLDVTATILDIAGADPGSGHGESLVGKVGAGPDHPAAQIGRDWVLSENMRHGMLRTDEYKLVVNYKTQKPLELYDLTEDPNETLNRLKDPLCQNIRKDLFAMMHDIVPSRIWGAGRPQRQPRRRNRFGRSG